MVKFIQLKTASVILILSLSSFIINAQVPVINSFSPASGPVGSTVTITGSGFDATPANNIVFFGAVKANIIAASATFLTVTVPPGATYSPIIITTNNLSGFSNQAFTVTFSPGGAITSNSFVEKYSFWHGGFYGAPAISDLDGDGKPDLMSFDYDTLSIFRYTSSATDFTFDNSTSLITDPFIVDIEAGDLDGDGKPDIIAVNTWADKISIFRNTSTPGVLSFEPKMDLLTNDWPKYVSIADMDSDGKTDILVTNTDSSVSIFRNISTGNTIAFSPKINFMVGSGTRPAIHDLDGDGKPDIAISVDYLNKISIFRNTGTTGIFSFASNIDIPAGTDPNNISVADIDGDGRPDLAVGTMTEHHFSIFRNTGSIGTISFAATIDFDAGINNPTSRPMYVVFGGLDGDGKPDLFVSCDDSNIYPGGSHSAFRNNSTPGNISLAPKVDLPIYGYSSGCLIADIDGNDKAELISVFNDDYQSALRIYRNKVAEPVDIYLCPPAGNTILTSNLSGSAYQWQVSSDSVNFTDINNAGYYSGTNTASLQLINIPSSNYGKLYRCIVDGGYSETFGIRFQNEWRWQSTHTQWEDASGWTCGTLPDANTDVIISNMANITLNSNVTINTLTVLPGATLTIGTGFNLTILH